MHKTKRVVVSSQYSTCRAPTTLQIDSILSLLRVNTWHVFEVVIMPVSVFCVILT